MDYQKAKILLSLITLILIVSNKAYSQTPCDATIHAVDSTIREIIFQQNKTAGHNDSETPFDTLKLKVRFTFDTYGVFKDIKVKKLHCLKCGDKDKKHFRDEIIKLILGVKGVKPCSEPLRFELPVRYVLYDQRK
ncbi:MAG: hypothetical protein IPN13_15005 [Bacteroidetes bacterium]|nr:hypothetical protein [Bacteroidota bacterium]